MMRLSLSGKTKWPVWKIPDDWSFHSSCVESWTGLTREAQGRGIVVLKPLGLFWDPAPTPTSFSGEDRPGML